MNDFKKAYSIVELAQSYSVSRALVYRAIAEGWGPKVTKINRRSIVLAEHAATWAKTLKARSDLSISQGAINGKC